MKSLLLKDVISMSDRVELFKEYVQNLNAQGVRSTFIYQYVADSLRMTKDEPTQIRRAKAFAYILEHVKQEVFPYELLVGTMAGMIPVYEKHLSIEQQEQLANQIIEEYLDKKRSGQNKETKQFEEGHIKSFDDDFSGRKTRWALMSRVYHDANIEYKELQDQIDRLKKKYAESEEIDGYEIGRELERAFKIPYPEEDKELYNSLPYFIGNHLSLNYAKVFSKGLKGFKEEIENYLNQETDNQKKEFYQASLISVSAVISFIQRYADTVEQVSKNESGQRKEELERISEILKTVSLQAPQTFYEALQLTWMLHIIANIQGGSSLSLGRIDQYLFPFYQADLEKGDMTRNEAKELLCCLWTKVNEPKMRTVQSITLGGITPEGNNAANDLTRLCLEVAAKMKYPYPNIGLRIHEKNPDWLYSEAIKTIEAGCGQPQIVNDSVWIPNLMELGYEESLANDYYTMGCVEIMIPGKQSNWGVTESIAFPILLEDVMQDIANRNSSVSSFEEYLNLFFKKLDAAILADYHEALDKQKSMKDRCFDSFSSMLIDGCLESGKDMFQDGAQCPTHWSFYAYGIGTLADSLCAIKKHVFDEKKYSLNEMCTFMKEDFKGYEMDRLYLDENTPHYGNGIEEVDSIAKQVLEHYSEKVFELNENSPRNKYVSTLFGYFFHIYHGEVGLATPNGRKKGEPYSDSMGPSQGKDVKGPTRLLKSVLDLGTKHITGGYALNFKVNGTILRSEQGQDAMADLFRGYMKNGGAQIQGYVTSTEDIQDALVHPEKHTDLIVRVGGYCEYFVNLDRALQREIAHRTLYGE